MNGRLRQVGRAGAVAVENTKAMRRAHRRAAAALPGPVTTPQATSTVARLSSSVSVTLSHVQAESESPTSENDNSQCQQVRGCDLCPPTGGCATSVSETGQGQQAHGQGLVEAANGSNAALDELSAGWFKRRLELMLVPGGDEPAPSGLPKAACPTTHATCIAALDAAEALFKERGWQNKSVGTSQDLGYRVDTYEATAYAIGDALLGHVIPRQDARDVGNKARKSTAVKAAAAEAAKTARRAARRTGGDEQAAAAKARDGVLQVPVQLPLPSEPRCTARAGAKHRLGGGDTASPATQDGLARHKRFRPGDPVEPIADPVELADAAGPANPETMHDEDGGDDDDDGDALQRMYELGKTAGRLDAELTVLSLKNERAELRGSLLKAEQKCANLAVECAALRAVLPEARLPEVQARLDAHRCESLWERCSECLWPVPQCCCP